jgi:GTP pyrophosphokinase
MNDINHWVEEFEDNMQDYEIFIFHLQQKVEKILKENNIFYVKTEARVKTLDSFKRKLEIKKQKYQNPLEDMTDILGIRIITYYREDLDAILKLLKENFKIDYKNSANKLKSLKYNEMGYLSLHYICQCKSSQKNLYGCNDFKFEVQIRTALQHIWAQIDHQLRYKTLITIPNKVQRKLFRISAMLESIDDEFDSIKHEVQVVENFYKDRFNEKEYSLRLDLSSINFYLKYNDKFIRSICKKLGVFHFNNFEVAKEENLEKKLIEFALQFNKNRVIYIEELVNSIYQNIGLILETLDKNTLKKINYLVNSSCSFIITFLLLLHEDISEIQKIYKLTDTSLEKIKDLRKIILLKGSN